MSKLSAAKRKALPKSDFAEPKSRKFPIEDKAHAKNAKARASEMEHKGKMSKSMEKRIDIQANKVLGKRTMSHGSRKMGARAK